MHSTTATKTTHKPQPGGTPAPNAATIQPAEPLKSALPVRWEDVEGSIAELERIDPASRVCGFIARTDPRFRQTLTEKGKRNSLLALALFNSIADKMKTVLQFRDEANRRAAEHRKNFIQREELEDESGARDLLMRNLSGEEHAAYEAKQKLRAAEDAAAQATKDLAAVRVRVELPDDTALASLRNQIAAKRAELAALEGRQSDLLIAEDKVRTADKVREELAHTVQHWEKQIAATRESLKPVASNAEARKAINDIATKAHDAEIRNAHEATVLYERVDRKLDQLGLIRNVAPEGTDYIAFTSSAT